MKADNPLAIEVVSDSICPWCYIGKRRLERALALLGNPPAQVRWKPFQLNPDMPLEGTDRRAYRRRKFGSWERSRQLDAQVAAAGREVGIAFDFERMQRTPNTLASHRLIWVAGQTGKQDAVVERIFRAYFLEGRDIGDDDVLTGIGVSAGVAEDEVRRALSGDDPAVGRALAEEAANSRAHVLEGVPTFVVNGEIAASGAQPEELLAQLLLRAQGDPRTNPAGGGAEGCR